MYLEKITTFDLHCKQNHKRIFWWTQIPIILVKDPHSCPLLKKHCMSTKKIFGWFQHPIKVTWITCIYSIQEIPKQSGCSHLTFMFTCGYISRNNIFFFVVKSLRNVIELTVQIYCKQQTPNWLFFLKFWVFYFVLLSTDDWLVYWCATSRPVHSQRTI